MKKASTKTFQDDMHGKIVFYQVQNGNKIIPLIVCDTIQSFPYRAHKSLYDYGIIAPNSLAQIELI